MFSEWESFAGTDCLVHKDGPFVERAVVGANYVDAFESQHILFYPVDFVPNLYSPMVEEKDLILLVQLIYQNGVFLLNSWLKRMEYTYHEHDVLVITPVKESVHFQALLLWDGEELLERIKEIKEHKVFVKPNLNVSGELFEQN